MARAGAESASICVRHPRLPRCVNNKTIAAVFALPPPAPPLPPAPPISLLLSAPVAAYVPAWYCRTAVRNWLRFTTSAHVVLHMDGARASNFTEPEWRWLHEGIAAQRVMLNPRRLLTWRRSGSLLAAHMHNYLYARKSLSDARPTHLLFLATNCFFIKPGVERYVSLRESSAAIRGCPEAPVKTNKHHCTTQAWFAPLNAHKATGRRLLIEGQFYPSRFVDYLIDELTLRDAAGRSKPTAGLSSQPPRRLSSRIPASSPATLLDALPSVPCTVEENLLPAVVLRAPRSLFGHGQPTEPVAWIPKSLSNGSFVEASTVRWLASSPHAPQILCRSTVAAAGSGGGGGGCAECPNPYQWPQTKFMVKRVPDDVADRSGVRRLIAALRGAARGEGNYTSGQTGLGGQVALHHAHAPV